MTHVLADASLAGLFDDARPSVLGHVPTAGALPALVPGAALALLTWGTGVPGEDQGTTLNCRAPH